MESLQSYFAEQGSSDIVTLGRYIERYIDEQWDRVFQVHQAKLEALYQEIGDSAYGFYGARLFKPIHEQLRQVGLRAAPRLPGGFSISREWGDDESDRQRWMWSKISKIDGEALGTIVCVFYHDHTQIRIPRPFRIIALTETSKGEVIAALSRLSADFASALEAKIEIAQYLAQMEAEKAHP